jgi:lipopolysaccharide/colanic/teichoic acid biosynthesis glycosyltransferase
MENGLKKLKKYSRRRTGASALYSEDAFHRLIQSERARADRGHGIFSLVVFDLSPELTLSAGKRFVRVLRERIRITDSAGWLKGLSIGVVLADASYEGGMVFARDILAAVAEIQPPPEHHVYTYPTASAELDNSPKIAGQAVGTDATGMEKIFNEMTASRASWAHRVFEAAAAVLILLVLSPLMLLIALAIKLNSPGPVLFSQWRIGYKGIPFRCYKFRTMHVNADTEVHENHFKTLIVTDCPMRKLDGDDPRIFRLGCLLRSSSLDELPQLFNIVRGEMSFIGPRPAIPGEYRAYLPWHRHRIDTLPGLTGLWQVSGKNKTTFAEMMRFDMHYARCRSNWMDLRIVLKTFPVILHEFKDHYVRKIKQHRYAKGSEDSNEPCVELPPEK